MAQFYAKIILISMLELPLGQARELSGLAEMMALALIQSKMAHGVNP